MLVVDQLIPGSPADGRLEDLGDACVMFLRQYGVNTSKIVRGGDRLGIYFLEFGAMQRPSKVIYDRANSAIATIPPDAIDRARSTLEPSMTAPASASCNVRFGFISR